MKNEKLSSEEVVAGVTQAMVDQWITQHGEGKVHCFEVPEDESYDRYIGGVVRDPSPGLLNEYLRKAERAPLDAAKMLIHTLWLGGDERIKTERAYMLAFMSQLSEVIAGGQGRKKKLKRSKASA